MLRSAFSEKRSEESEFCSDHREAGCGPMHSVADARTITRDLADMLAPSQGWKRQVSAVYRALTDQDFPWRIEELTWNRVKSWFFAEARRVDYHEMVALKERKAIEEAQREHREFVATTTRLAAALAGEGAALTRKQMEVLERIARGQAHVPGNPHARQGRSVRPVGGTGAEGAAR